MVTEGILKRRHACGRDVRKRMSDDLVAEDVGCDIFRIPFKLQFIDRGSIREDVLCRRRYGDARAVTGGE